ncbi:MAG: DUF3685 domain-containing protein [Oscillatoria sp. SIO1A7]|nr:DUF3685 domain-containing protein [Oscillatoria sp. SIO1A7]
MTNAAGVKILLLDRDPIFMLGLNAFLSREPDLEVVAQANEIANALEQLAERAALSNPPADLVVVDWGSLDAKAEAILPAESEKIEFLQQLQTQYPKMPVLLYSSSANPALLRQAKAIGISGYCPKGAEPTVLLSAIREIARGQTYWSVIPESGNSETQAGQTEPWQTEPWQTEKPGSFAEPAGSFSLFKHNLRLRGNQQIDAEVARLETLLRNRSVSVLDRFFLLGRRRELLVARWTIALLFGSPPRYASNYDDSGGSDRYRAGKAPGKIQAGKMQGQLAALASEPENPTPATLLGDGDIGDVSLEIALEEATGSLEKESFGGVLTSKALQSALFEETLDKLRQSRLPNLTDVALEIDILRTEKKKQLCFLILREFEHLLAELRFSQVMPEQIPQKSPAVVRDLWEATVTEFFGKYASLQVGDRQLDIVPLLLEDAEIVQQSILDKIPRVADLLAHILFQVPIAIENMYCAAGSPEAMQLSLALLENLMLQVANGTIEPMLNRFADVEAIKQGFYDRRWISTRELEKFRNNLSWKYRWEKYWLEPKAIFESQFLLLVVEESGIIKISSYAPRNQELANLNNIQQTTTLVLEIRDAVSPRVRSLLVGAGSAGRYLLVQLGRGIGFVGRGILQGIGSSWPGKRTGNNQNEK